MGVKKPLENWQYKIFKGDKNRASGASHARFMYINIIFKRKLQVDPVLHRTYIAQKGSAMSMKMYC